MEKDELASSFCEHHLADSRFVCRGFLLEPARLAFVCGLVGTHLARYGYSVYLLAHLAGQEGDLGKGEPVCELAIDRLGNSTDLHVYHLHPSFLPKQQ